MSTTLKQESRETHTETVELGNAEELNGSKATHCRKVVLKQPCQWPTTESTATSAISVHQVQPKTPFSHWWTPNF